MAEQIPNAWKGQEVEILYQGRKAVRGKTGTLEDLTDRGVVLREDEDAYFYPWASVIYIKHEGGPAGTASSPTSIDGVEGFGPVQG